MYHIVVENAISIANILNNALVLGSFEEDLHLFAIVEEALIHLFCENSDRYNNLGCQVRIEEQSKK